jgi:type I restriction enzyme R subunit
MEANIKSLNDIYDKAKKLERENRLLSEKYNYDKKYARIHKRLMEKDPLTDKERKLFDALNGLRIAVDNEIQQNFKIMENESYVQKMVTRLIVNQFKNEQKMDISPVDVKRINSIVVSEYMRDYNGLTV